MPFSPKSRGIKDTEMVLDGAMEHRLNRVISANSTFCRGFSQEEHGFQSSKQIGALPRPQWLQFLESGRGCTENQSNRFLAVAPCPPQLFPVRTVPLGLAPDHLAFGRAGLAGIQIFSLVRR